MLSDALRYDVRPLLFVTLPQQGEQKVISVAGNERIVIAFDTSATAIEIAEHDVLLEVNDGTVVLAGAAMPVLSGDVQLIADGAVQSLNEQWIATHACASQDGEASNFPSHNDGFRSGAEVDGTATYCLDMFEAAFDRGELIVSGEAREEGVNAPEESHLHTHSSVASPFVPVVVEETQDVDMVLSEDPPQDILYDFFDWEEVPLDFDGTIYQEKTVTEIGKPFDIDMPQVPVPELPTVFDKPTPWGERDQEQFAELHDAIFGRQDTEHVISESWMYGKGEGILLTLDDFSSGANTVVLHDVSGEVFVRVDMEGATATVEQQDTFWCYEIHHDTAEYYFVIEGDFLSDLSPETALISLLV